MVLIWGELAWLYVGKTWGEVTLLSPAQLCSSEELEMGGEVDGAAQLYFMGQVRKENHAYKPNIFFLLHSSYIFLYRCLFTELF